MAYRDFVLECIMDQFFEFVINHWELWLLLLGIIILLLVNEYITKVQGVPQLAVNDVVTLMNKEDAVVVDIRELNDYSAGHITGAVHISRNEITDGRSQLEKYKDKPIILACAQGQQTTAVARKLKQSGIANLHILKGGMTAWKGANLPLKKGVK